MTRYSTLQCAAQIKLEESEDHPPGLILPNGDINWNCPCLGGMAVGPCGVEFRDAFSCFHHSQAEVKGSDCLEKFADMQKCMQKYPELFEEKDKKEEASSKEEAVEPTPSEPAEEDSSKVTESPKPPDSEPVEKTES